MRKKSDSGLYSQEFKDEIARSVLTGERRTFELMKEYGVSRESVKNWTQQYKEKHPEGIPQNTFADSTPKKFEGVVREKVYLPRLKELRVRLGYSQSDIGTVLGIQQDAYAKYETGMVELPVRRLMILSRFYHVTTDYLLSLSDDMTVH